MKNNEVHTPASLDISDWHCFSKICDYEQLKGYFAIRQQNKHQYLYHYTNMLALGSMIRGNSLRLSAVDNFNDKTDKEEFGNASARRNFFSFCFSSGKNENLPLWYMYAGLDGKGVRLRLTKTRVEQLINDGKYYLTAYDYKNHREIENAPSFPLQNGKTMRLRFGDVVYYCNSKGRNVDRKPETVDLKYNTMTNYNKVAKADFDRYKKENVGFTKKLAWYYEKESRLVVELIGPARSFLESDKEYAVFLTPPFSLSNQLHVTFAPEIKDSATAVSYVSERMKRENNPEIKTLWQSVFDFCESSKVESSEYAGTVNMNFCGKCKSYNLDTKGERTI